MITTEYQIRYNGKTEFYYSHREFKQRMAGLHVVGISATYEIKEF